MILLRMLSIPVTLVYSHSSIPAIHTFGLFIVPQIFWMYFFAWNFF